MFIEKKNINHILIFWGPYLSFKESSKHLHPKKLFEKRFLIVLCNTLIFFIIKACLYPIRNLDLLPVGLCSSDKLVIVSKYVDKKVKELSPYLIDLLGCQWLLLSTTSADYILQIFRQLLAIFFWKLWQIVFLTAFELSSVWQNHWSLLLWGNFVSVQVYYVSTIINIVLCLVHQAILNTN